MQVQFFARREVTVLGRKYVPGEQIDDPAIPPRVLTAMMNNRRVEQRITDGSTTPGNIPVTAKASKAAGAPPWAGNKE